MTEATNDRIIATRQARLQARFATHVQTVAVGSVLAVLFVYFAFAADRFITYGNLLNIGRQIAPTMAVAVAMTFVITTAGIDLSVGSIVALSGSVLAIELAGGWSPTLALLSVIAMGAVLGAINGWFTAYQAVPPFIVTLATLSILRGTALRATEGYSTPITVESWVVSLGQGRVAGVPVPAIIAVAIAVVGWVVYAKTPFGRYVVGLGSQAESLRRVGVDVRKVGLAVYVITGTVAALAGVMIATRLASGSSNAGVGFELEVITAVVLGGTSLFGGRGSILGTILGALLLAVIANGLVLLGISPFWVQIVQGSILLLAIFMNQKLFARFATAKR